MLCPMQTLLLLEAESFGGRVQGGAESWAEQMETLLTEELDGRLRAHRPRAGRIEEEVSSQPALVDTYVPPCYTLLPVPSGCSSFDREACRQSFHTARSRRQVHV